MKGGKEEWERRGRSLTYCILENNGNNSDITHLKKTGRGRNKGGVGANLLMACGIKTVGRGTIKST